MAGWEDTYSEGSFRGVAFKTERHDAEGGRRGMTHEFPQRDLPWREDLGRRARLWTITCFVIGSDYMTDRDALVDALEKGGSGVLVHPYLGQLDVDCEDYRYSESTEEGGIARFTIDFVESGKTQAGDASQDTAALAAAKSDAFLEEAPGQFQSCFSVDAMPAFVEQGAADLVGGFTGSIRDAAKLLGGAGKALRAYEAGLQLLDGAVTLVRTPFVLAENVRGVIRSIAGLGAVPLLRLRSLRRLIDDGQRYRPVIGMTPVRIRERDNAQAFSSLVTSIAAAEAVKVIGEVRFTSHEEAAAVRDGFAEQLDTVAIAAADRGDDYQADLIDTLRRSMVRDVTARGASLARVYAYSPAASEPAIVIAHRIYDVAGLADREAEIVARNHIRHPGFVPAAIALELLTPTGAEERFA